MRPSEKRYNYAVRRSAGRRKPRLAVLNELNERVALSESAEYAEYVKNASIDPRVDVPSLFYPYWTIGSVVLFARRNANAANARCEFDNGGNGGALIGVSRGV